MRVALVLAVLALAGCSGSDAPPTEASEPTDAAGAEMTFEDTVVVLGETFAYALDHDLPPTTMEVPRGGSSLKASLILRGSPCGAAADAADQGQAAVLFTSPSGQVTDVRFAGALGCDPGGVATESTVSQGLGYEAGTWQVDFAGRGMGASLEVLVVAEPPQADQGE